MGFDLVGHVDFNGTLRNDCQKKKGVKTQHGAHGEAWHVEKTENIFVFNETNEIHSNVSCSLVHIYTTFRSN